MLTAIITGGEIRAVLLSLSDSAFEELSNPGLPLNGGPDGAMGSDVGVQRGT